MLTSRSEVDAAPVEINDSDWSKSRDLDYWNIFLNSLTPRKKKGNETQPRK